MTTFLQEAFANNQPVVYYVYGLVFFILGLAIILQSRRHSRLTLARRLHWLALFGFSHALHEWGDVFIPLQATYMPPPIIDLLRAVQLGLLAISFTCLFQFGANLIRPIPAPWTWLRLLPISVLLVWSLAAWVWLTITPVSLSDWFLLSAIWARYLIGFPGAALAAYALRCYASRLISPFNEPGILRMLRLAALALAGYAVMGGLIVPPGPHFPANWLNSELLESWLGVPVVIFRSGLGLALALAMIRILEIFDLEIDRRLSSLEESQILATERERIGRDLHDRTLQAVYGAGLMLNASAELLQESREDALESLSQARLTLDQAVEDIRRHIVELRPHPASLNLNEGLTKLLKESVLPSMAEIALTLDLPENHYFNDHQVGHILAVAGEAFSNVARHAQARRVQVAAHVAADCLCLMVADDGRGVPADYVAGYGLHNMRERARLLGGELTVWSRPDQGTRLELKVPWETSYEENHDIDRR